MKGIQAVLCVMFLVILSSCDGKQDGSNQAASSAPAPTPSVKTFSNSALDFTFDYPSDWTTKEKDNRVGVFSPDEKAAILASRFYNIPEGEKAEDIFENVIVGPYSQSDSFGFRENLLDLYMRYINPEDAQGYNAEEGYCGEFIGQVDGAKARFYVIILKKGTSAFQIMSYALISTEDKYKFELSDAVNSFTLKE